MVRRPPGSTPFPSTTLFRSCRRDREHRAGDDERHGRRDQGQGPRGRRGRGQGAQGLGESARVREAAGGVGGEGPLDRKSTRLNSSHSQTSYAVFCLKKKTQE